MKKKPKAPRGFKPVLGVRKKRVLPNVLQTFEKIKDQIPGQQRRALEAFKQLGSKGATPYELAEYMHIAPTSAERVISHLLATGQVRYYKDRTRTSPHGGECSVVVYVRGWDDAQKDARFVKLFDKLAQDHVNWEEKRQRAADLIAEGRYDLLRTLDRIHARIRKYRRQGSLS